MPRFMLALVTADDRDQLKDVRASWKGAVCEGEGDELRIMLTSGDELPLGAVTDRGTLPNGNLMVRANVEEYGDLQFYFQPVEDDSVPEVFLKTRPVEDDITKRAQEEVAAALDDQLSDVRVIREGKRLVMTGTLIAPEEYGDDGASAAVELARDADEDAIVAAIDELIRQADG